MYHSYFGLDEQAFSIAVNPRYLYMSAQHREALAHLLYGVSSGGFVMLSGEVGTGKTTIIRCLLEQLPETADLAIVMNPSASARDLLCSICDEFGVDYSPDETSLKVLTDKLTAFLVANHQRGRKSIVLIDEAQLLRISTLEQVRLLTNLETNTEKLLQIILVGQPELNELLAKPALRQLSQRITARYHLRPLSEAETEAYIKHRLTVAGMPAGRQPFPPSIVRKVHQISRGIPRLVNILCDRMLLGAYSRDTNLIDGQICRQATIEVLGVAPEESFRRYHHWVYAGTGALAALVLATVVWLLVGARQAEKAVPEITVLAQGSILREQPLIDAGPQAELATSSFGESSWLRNQDHALIELLDVLEIDYDGALYPCWVIARQGYKCESQSAPAWDTFRAINRPAVLRVSTQTKESAYVVLVAIKDDEAWIRSQGKMRRIALEDLGKLWTGEFVFIWKRPETFKEPIGVGARGPLVAWIAQQFAALDQQGAPLAQEHFNTALEQRVKIFQREQGLPDDGFVGMRTLLKLNEALGAEKSLEDFDAALISMGSE
jgi:general secretion pathway protein A